MPNALIVADDLTGALDAGHGVADRGRAVRTLLSEAVAPAEAAAGDVVAIDADSRAADARTAAKRVRRAFDAVDAPIAFKKVDSTLRGHLVAEVDAALEAVGASLAVVAPAFPAADRRTRAGVHYVEGRPVAEAGYGVVGSDLRERFAASEHPVVHVGRDALDAGPAGVRGAIARSGGRRIAVCDAEDDADLETIVAAAGALDGDVLYVGSAGLAGQLPVPGEPGPAPTPDPSGEGGLAVAGSTNPRTIEQVAAVPERVRVDLDPTAAVRDPGSAAEDVVPALVRRLEREGRAVLTAAPSAEAVIDPADADPIDRGGSGEETDAADGEPNATDGEPDATDGNVADAGDRIARSLALAAAETVAERPPRGVFLTGGRVARATLDALGAAAVDLTGTAAGDGVPVGIVSGGAADGTPVITKAGGFGSPGTIVNCLDGLRGRDD